MNILLTSVGRRSYMISYFKNALHGIGEVHAANNPDVYSMQVADYSVKTPLIYDPTYIDFLLEYCRKNEINAILSLFDMDSKILAINKSKFLKNNINVLVSDLDIIQICNDKWLSFNFLKDKGYSTPITFLSLSESIQALNSGLIQFPLMLKPRWGMGSIGIFEADTLPELEVLYAKSIQSIRTTYLKYESFSSTEQSIIIQEKISGTEFGLDVFNDLEGNFLSCIPKRKIDIRNGETISAEIVSDTTLINLGEKLSKDLHHIANLDVDVIISGENNYIIDLNCRFGGQYPFCHLAGTNFPEAIVQMLLNKPFDPKVLEATPGTIGFKDILPVKLNPFS